MDCKQTPRARPLPGNQNFYAVPMVNVGGTVRPMHAGESIAPCFLPANDSVPGGVDFDNQVLQITGNQLSITGGNSVALPGVPAPTIGTPPLAQSASIPSDVVGTDTYLLAAPATWATVIIGGTTYVTPLYLPQ